MVYWTGGSTMGREVAPETTCTLAYLLSSSFDDSSTTGDLVLLGLPFLSPFWLSTAASIVVTEMEVFTSLVGC